MRKTVFRFWLVNLLLIIVLFMLYRVVIAELQPADTTLLERFFNIMDILLNLGFSLIYLVVMVAGSFSVFLNLIEKIRHSYFLSFLTFSGIPLFCVVFLAVNVSIDIYRYNLAPAPLITLLCFSITYLVCAVITFLIFRKKVKL
ncbi:small-conductance mechanosensitive channel [Pedobacter africanus]|uniref:Small-conductance mechanosensitive channel n=1 Tax=Pedobacter africanus TaxID=151894 RepID=A0ACC6KZF0_9SPHI|nr:small-conductance mechanosensitive channel [Pedobacter africanus]